MALYPKGVTTRDTQEIVRELFGVDVSATLVSEIMADLDVEATAWPGTRLRVRPLSPVWPIVYFDGIVVHVRSASGKAAQHTAYVTSVEFAARGAASAPAAPRNYPTDAFITPGTGNQSKSIGSVENPTGDWLIFAKSAE